LPGGGPRFPVCLRSTGSGAAELFRGLAEWWSILRDFYRQAIFLIQVLIRASACRNCLGPAGQCRVDEARRLCSGIIAWWSQEQIVVGSWLGLRLA
jgi:hypothetical protein